MVRARVGFKVGPGVTRANMQERRRSSATRRRSASWIAEAPGVGDGRAVASRLQRSRALTGLPTVYCTGRDTVHAGFRPDQSSLAQLFRVCAEQVGAG